jgi:hypothetical protein
MPTCGIGFFARPRTLLRPSLVVPWPGAYSFADADQRSGEHLKASSVIPRLSRADLARFMHEE